jgi:hypothetical protein
MDESRVTAACSTRRRPQRLDERVRLLDATSLAQAARRPSAGRSCRHRVEDVRGRRHSWLQSSGEIDDSISLKMRDHARQIGDPSENSLRVSAAWGRQVALEISDLALCACGRRRWRRHETPPRPMRVLRLALGTRLLIRERCRRGRDPEGHRQRADSSSGLHCRGGWPRRADASGDEPLTGLPWRPKQLERMRLRYPCRPTCQCATATPAARWISGRIRSSR